MAWRNIGRRKARSSLTVLGVAIGISAIVFLASIMGGLESQFLSILERGEADLVVVQRGSGDLMLSRLKESEVSKLAEIAGVEAVSPALFGVSKVENYPFFVVNGLRVDGFTIDHFSVVDGRKLEEQDRRGLLLGKGSADVLGKGVGDTVALLGDEYEVVGIYETGVRFEDYGGVIRLEEAQRTFESDGYVSLAEIKVADVKRLEEVRSTISLQFASFEVSVPGEVASRQEDLQLIRGATSVVSLVSILFGAIIVMNTTIMSVYERTREIGVLRALGWRKRRILTMILKETLLLAMVGGGIGITVAIAGVEALDVLAFIPMSGRIDPQIFLYGVGAAILLGLLGGLYPAVRASRMSPIEALGHEV